MNELNFNKTIRLRSHHLVCLCHFIGEGYTPEFVNNIVEILKLLKKNSSKKIVEIVNNDDDVCAACFKTKSLCNKLAIECMDKAYLEVLKLKVGTHLSYMEMCDKVKLLVNNKIFKRCCKGCSWFNLCSSIRDHSTRSNF